MSWRRSVDRFLRAVVPFAGLFTVSSGPTDCGGGGDGSCKVTQEQAQATGKVEGGTVSLDDSGDAAFDVPLRGFDDGVRGGWRCFGQVTGHAVQDSSDGSRLPIPLTASISCQLTGDTNVTKRVWTFTVPLPESRLDRPPSRETPIKIETNLSLPSGGAQGCNAVLDGTIVTVVDTFAGASTLKPDYVTDDFVRDLSITVRFDSTACGLRAGTLDIDLHLDASSYTHENVPLCL